uniref:Uncharacterized protein n=1 Tax=viral metagenome TaxID=1070528 RepID=A0A6C0L920_9ZZZZ
MVIHTFGDSHSFNGWGEITNLETHHLGPKLCFSIGRDGIIIKDGYNVNNGDTVIFSFGEIDCRCHIHKHITETKNYKEIIDSIVNNYFIQIQDAVNTFDNLRTVIYNVVPPIQKHNTNENKSYPYLGTDEERKSYVLYFNSKLKQTCIEYKFLFFDVYNKYIDSNGFLNKSFSDGNVHILNGVYIKQFVEDNLL